MEDAGRLALGGDREEKNAARIGFGQRDQVLLQVLQAFCQLLRQHALGLDQGQGGPAFLTHVGQRAAAGWLR
jgi:hypothetical protein